MDPPPCVQNAMMKQDKKPFTYTPGGINLSEIKSPRMQRRIEQNANAQGVGEAPRPPPPAQQNLGNLPPSALAAMRPQPQVQVFPGPPPAPPMQQRAMPPPPPPPMQPLPTQKVVSGNESFDRPDMTKIIPENPMALLRKTGGPAPRKSLVDDMFLEQNRAPAPPQRQYEAQSPRYAPHSPTPPSPPVPQRQPQPQYQPPQQQYQTPKSPESPKLANYQAPVIERKEPTKTSTAHLGSLYIPPAGQQQKAVSPPTPPERNQQQMQSPGTPTLKEAPKPWQVKSQQKQEELPAWAKREDPNEREVQVKTEQTQSPPATNRWQPASQPPVNQQAQSQNQWPNQANTQSSNQWPNQQQQPQQTWQPQQQTYAQPTQQKWQPQPQSQPQQQPQPVYQQGPAPQKWQPQQSSIPPAQPQSHIQYSQPGVPVRIEIRTNMRPPQMEDENHPNAVYVTQPIVLQHPGPRITPSGNRPSEPRPQVQQTPKVDSQGARIIPIHIEGRTPPSTPGADRTLTRQQSWGNNPSQSNSFKVIQRITQTDDDVDDDTPVTQHSARYPQNFQQSPADQMRKMQLSDGDRDLMNRFKQELIYYNEENPRYRGGHIPSKVFRMIDESGVDEDMLQRESDPRYRGAAIPSKAFKLLQKQIGCDSDVKINNSNNVVTSVPQQNMQQPGRNQPKSIPVQIEGNGHTNYVHPSEQTVPEPKKYTGSSIPSRSFKILQAMTAPDTCANVNSNEDNPYETNYNCYDYVYPPAFYPPPYWHPYYYEQPEPLKNQPTQKESSRNGRATPLGRTTPVPFWPPPPPPAYYGLQKGNDNGPNNNSHRETPVPFWSPPYMNYQPPEENIDENQQSYPAYPIPYFDPYYYSFYYGYPHMMHYPPYSQKEEPTGYCSMDEAGPNSKYGRRRRNSMDGEQVERASNYFQRSKSATPRIVVTPTSSFEDKNKELIKKIELINDNESDTSETETEEETTVNRGHNSLQSIKSVPDINVYAIEESCDDDSSDSSDDSEGDEPSIIGEEEIIPHQLSVIFEESERTDSRLIRSVSVLSDSTTIAEKSDQSEDEDDLYENLSIPMNFSIQVANKKYENISMSMNNNEVKSFGERHVSSSCNAIVNGVSMKSYKSEETKFATVSIPNNKTNYASNTVYNNKSKLQKSYSTYSNNDPEDDSDGIHIEEVTNEGKQSDEDWWGVLGKEDDLPAVKEGKSDKNYSRANTIYQNKIPEEREENEKLETESHCVVKYRNKRHNEDSLTVYDKIKENDASEPQNTGRIMEMESFVDKLEQIKRNSGLWDLTIESKNDADKEADLPKKINNLQNTYCKIDQQTNSEISKKESKAIDFWSEPDLPEKIQTSANYSDSKISNQIKEEPNTEKSEEIDFWGQSDLAQTIHNSENADCKIESNIDLETNKEEPEEIDFWSQLKNDSDDDFKPRRRSYYRDDYEYENEENSSVGYLNSSQSLSNDASNNCQEIKREKSNSINISENEINEVVEEMQCKVEYETINAKPTEIKADVDEVLESKCVNDNHESITKNNFNKTNIQIKLNVNEYSLHNISKNERTDSKTSEEEVSDTEESSSSSGGDQKVNNIVSNEINNNCEEDVKPLTIKERIMALHQSVNQKQKKVEDDSEVKVSVKDKISLIEISRGNISKNTSTKSSLKSFEDYSEEEGDSGVLSDISRHISDTEEFPELKKLTRYERAATHSRLFKLLQEGYDDDDDDDETEYQNDIKEDKFAKLSVRRNMSNRKVSPSRSQLSLPLKTLTKSVLEEHETNENKVNQKLVEELVQSLLKKKKGQIFRNMPREKLHAAALKILQEDYTSCTETPEDFSSLLSPLRGDTQSSTPAQTPQEFYGNYNEYKDYYDSWGDANIRHSNDSEEILSSKAFQLLREHIESNKMGSVEGLVSKYSRLTSSKHINKEAQRRSNYSQSPASNPQTNEVTNTS